MERSVPQPHTINTLRRGADAAMAMLAGIQLEVFTPLRDGPMTAEQIADAIGVGPARLRLLLYALVAAGLLTEQDGRFSNTPEAHHFLVKDAPASMGNLLATNAYLWGIMLKTADSIRTGVPQAHVDFSHAPQEDLETFLRMLYGGTVATAYELAEHDDFSSVRTLVDVGGGGGGLTITLTKGCPHLQATVVDLPQVTPITQKIVDEEGATHRVTILAADIVHDPLPGMYDVAVLRALLQVLSPNDARRAVQHISAAINPGGTIYIVGRILDDSRTSPPGAVGFNLAAINEYYAGGAYTEHEHREWLSAAGFVDIKRVKVLGDGSGAGLMTARKRL